MQTDKAYAAPRLLHRVLLAVAVLAATVAAVAMWRTTVTGFLAVNVASDLLLLSIVNVYCPACLHLGPRQGRLGARVVEGAVLLGLVASLAVNLVENFQIHAPVGRFQLNLNPAQVHGVLGQVVLLLAVCVAAPFAENAFFFGLPIHLERAPGRHRWLRHALLAVGVGLFVAAHGPTWLGAVLYLVPAVLIAAVYWRRGYLASVVVHASFNATAFYLLPLIFH